LAHGPLSERSRHPPLPQQFAHPAVRGSVLCSCTHVGRKLGSRSIAPSSGAGELPMPALAIELTSSSNPPHERLNNLDSESLRRSMCRPTGRRIECLQQKGLNPL
jgi:hypothetical protein